jgi:hypothetical protein
MCRHLADVAARCVQAKLGWSAEETAPIDVSEAVSLPHPRQLPPHNGFGSEEDSAQNCISLVRPCRSLELRARPSLSPGRLLPSAPHTCCGVPPCALQRKRSATRARHSGGGASCGSCQILLCLLAHARRCPRRRARTLRGCWSRRASCCASPAACASPAPPRWHPQSCARTPSM